MTVLSGRARPAAALAVAWLAVFLAVAAGAVGPAAPAGVAYNSSFNNAPDAWTAPGAGRGKRMAARTSDAHHARRVRPFSA